MRLLTRPLSLGVAALVAALALGGSSSADAAPPPRVPVLITFDRPPAQAERALVQQGGGSVTESYQIVPAVAASLPPAAIEALQRHPRVLRVEPDVEIAVVDLGAELQASWGVQRIGAGQVHAGGNTGAGVRVAVLDTGIDTTHPDLAYDPACSAAFGFASIHDAHGHGTRVAGVIAAQRNGAGVVGVAPDAGLCVLKILNDEGKASYSNVLAALDYIARFNATNPGHPIRVTNHSYGGLREPGVTVRVAFEQLHGQGVLHIGAAGNDGLADGSGSNCIYPARWSALVATAATRADDGRAEFSSTCDEVEIAAPGQSIRSTTPGGYANGSGTSLAAPHVAGVAALVMAADAGQTSASVRALLTGTALDLGPAGRDRHFGHGLVLAAAAVPAPPAPPPPPPPAEQPPAQPPVEQPPAPPAGNGETPPLSEEGAILGDVPAGGGFAIIVFSGGSPDLLRASAAASGCDLTSVFASSNGRLVGHVMGAPGFVNASFTALFPAGISPNTGLIMVCRRAVV